MKTNDKGWPIDEQGKPIKMGDLPQDVQRALFQASADRVAAEFRQPAMIQHLSNYLAELPVATTAEYIGRGE